MQDVNVSIIFENIPDDIDPRIIENWVFDNIMDGADWSELESKTGYELDPPCIDLF